MAAPKGNQFWKLRSKHGRDKLFATPELLWEAATEYFEWCDKNPWEVKDSKVKRPYTLSGFMVYIHSSETFWREFRKAKHQDFLSVIDEIEHIIETQQFEGASVGAFNANIIARKLGLSDQQDRRFVNKDGDDIIPKLENLTPQEWNLLLALKQRIE